MPDNIIFGREVFARAEAEQLDQRLALLQDLAQQQLNEVAVTALLAMRASSSLLLLSHIVCPPTITQARAQEVRLMGMHMEQLLEIHRTRSSQKES